MTKTASALNLAAAKAPSMGTFERFLTLWVALCIVAGVALGQATPGIRKLISRWQRMRRRTVMQGIPVKRPPPSAKRAPPSCG